MKSWTTTTTKVGNTHPQLTASGEYKGTLYHFDPGHKYSLPDDVGTYFESKGMLVPVEPHQAGFPKGRADVGQAKKSMSAPENK